jgi:hypothetical protein
MVPRRRASFYLNLASGASIVLVETLFFLVALALGPRTGLLSRSSRQIEAQSS